jgi:ribulose-bisphosphate carboxylase large chain
MAGLEYLRVTYRLRCEAGEDPWARAEDIAFEQTVELPPGCVSDSIRESTVGRVESLDRVGDNVWAATIDFPESVLDGSASQLMVLLFGNISLKTGVVVEALEIPKSLLHRFPGPAFGVDGIRRLCGVSERRPLLCTAIKPLGLSPPGLADLCYQFAMGGVDLIKDDHGLADQRSAGFADRVARCAEAVDRANRETGGASMYLPHVSGAGAELDRRIRMVRQAGCRGALASPLTLGLDAVTALARESGLALLAHPALAGSYFHPTHGIAPSVLLGSVFRLIGSDGVIYPNVGGRFAFTEKTCSEVNAALTEPLGQIKPAFPLPAGGIDVDRVPYWVERYGPDTVFLIGGSLYGQGDLAEASKRLREVLSQI